MKRLTIILVTMFLLMFGLALNISAEDKREGWFYDFETALKQAKAEAKPLFIFFSHPWCSDCKDLWKALEEPSVAPQLKDFIPLYFDIDEARPITKELAVRVVPHLLVLDPRDMSRIVEHTGYLKPDRIVEFLKNGLEEYRRVKVVKEEKILEPFHGYTLRYRKNIGYSLESKDRNVVVDFWTIQFLQTVNFPEGEHGDDTSRYKHSLFGISATLFKNFTLMTQFDFTQDTSFEEFEFAEKPLLDLYAEYQVTKPINLRVGRFKVPMGRQYLPMREYWDFVEGPNFILPLLPKRDVGAMVYGGGGYRGLYMEYVFGVVDGVPDGYDFNNENKEFIGKLCFKPFPRPDFLFVFEGAYTYRKVEEPLGKFGISTGSGINKLFSFKKGASYTGHRDRLNLATELFYKNINLGAEKVTWRADISDGSKKDNTNISATSAWLAWVITGEYKMRDEWLIPKRPYGALEIVLRYSTLKIDEDLLPFAKTFVKDAENWTGGFNWYLTRHFKFMLNYSYTSFDREILNLKGNLVDEEKALLGAIQVAL
jgi:phosphate-selective porin OprO/OprP